MTLRDAMFGGGIVLGALDRSDPALTGDTALELGTDFLTSTFLHRIRTTTRQHSDCE